jgi:hypothetical protein
MRESDLSYFAQLKKEIVSVLQQTIPSVSREIENWKGQDIVYFQEDLAKKINGRISEKWFYTHLKAENNKLPRIDMLNLLSRYAGYTDWADFKLKHGEKLPDSVTVKPRKKKIIFLISAGILVLVISYLILKPKTYSFCFIDADRKTTITDQNIQVIVLNDGESPIYSKCVNGCFSLKTRNSKIKFVVKAPYYKIDTITRLVNSQIKNERVQLHTNDYALMIHFFSKSKVSDWQKRRKQLDNMFTDNAQIYQVYDDNTGMELYNKHEFINKLTMPIKSLENIEIIETIYTGNRISALRFRQIQNQ